MEHGKQKGSKRQFSLHHLIGVAKGDQAVYSNIPEVYLSKNRSQLWSRNTRLIDFATGEINMEGYEFQEIKQINPEYDSHAFIRVNGSCHDLVKYQRVFSHANALLVKHIDVVSSNSKVNLNIVTREDAGTNDIHIFMHGALEDVSQIQVEERDGKIVIALKEHWEYVPTDRTVDNANFDRRYYSIEGEIKPGQLEKREVELNIRVPKGTNVSVL